MIFFFWQSRSIWKSQYSLSWQCRSQKWDKSVLANCMTRLQSSGLVLKIWSLHLTPLLKDYMGKAISQLWMDYKFKFCVNEPVFLCSHLCSSALWIKLLSYSFLGLIPLFCKGAHPLSVFNLPPLWISNLRVHLCGQPICLCCVAPSLYGKPAALGLCPNAYSQYSPLSLLHLWGGAAGVHRGGGCAQQKCDDAIPPPVIKL